MGVGLVLVILMRKSLQEQNRRDQQKGDVHADLSQSASKLEIVVCSFSLVRVFWWFVEAMRNDGWGYVCVRICA